MVVAQAGGREGGWGRVLQVGRQWLVVGIQQPRRRIVGNSTGVQAEGGRRQGTEGGRLP